jgi:hypothetical protein
MKYVVEIGSVAMIYTYVSSLMKIGSCIQTLVGGYTDRMEIA